MSFANIRAEIKTLLLTVTGIGKVHDYRRHSTTWEEIFKRHKKDQQINNWEITRRATGQEIDNVQNSAGVEPFFQDTHDIIIVGHMALKDEKASEKTFQDLVDAIVAKIRLNIELSQTVLIPRPIQVPIIEHRMFGGILVHFAELEMLAVERVGG